VLTRARVANHAPLPVQARNLDMLETRRGREGDLPVRVQATRRAGICAGIQVGGREGCGGGVQARDERASYEGILVRAQVGTGGAAESDGGVGMAWTRIDDKFLLNPKVQTVGVYGMALYLSGLIYCNGNLTDGFIMEGVLPMLCGMAFQTPARKIADKLVEVNLWEAAEGGYQIHDFLTFNKSKQEIELLNKTRANNGAKGGRLPKQTETELLSKQVSKQVSKQPPIIPNPLSLIPKPLKEKEVVDSSSSSFESPFIDVYVKATGIEPKRTEEEKELIQRFVKLGVQPIEYQKAIQEMQTKGYKIASMLSAETWTMNNRNGKKAHKPEPGSYEAWQVKLQADKMSINQKGA
jgi:hypothetical protein